MLRPFSLEHALAPGRQAVAILACVMAACIGAAPAVWAKAPTAPPDVPPAHTIAAPTLSRDLAKPAAQRPVLLHVGFGVLYRSGHIPGSIYAGPGSTPEGLAILRRAAEPFSRNREVVVYCGCCPWKDCPNIQPALKELRRLGFTKVRALYLPKDFYSDWVDKGLPAEKGK